MVDIKRLIERFHLEPLEMEGGHCYRGYLSGEKIPPGVLPSHYPQGERPFGSAIYYLLTDAPDSFSRMHRLPGDEVYHFYLGDAVELLLLYPDGSTRRAVLGSDIFAGQEVQFVVPAGVWQGSRLIRGGEFALLGTTMAPAFQPCDFEAGDREVLTARYPSESERIAQLTWE